MAKEFITFPFQVEQKADGDAPGVFRGYGAVFSNLDLGNDVIEPGAFTDSLKSLTALPLLWNHDTSAPVGKVLEYSQDNKGLKVVGQLILKHDDGTDFVPGKNAYTLMKSGVVTGMSIGYRLARDKRGMVKPDAVSWDNDGRRTLKALQLHELSLATIPMNPKAQVASIKSLLDSASERELEHALREAGISVSDAKILVAAVKGNLRDAGYLPDYKARCEAKKTGASISQADAAHILTALSFERAKLSLL